MSKAIEWIEDVLGAVMENNTPENRKVIEACGRGCAVRAGRMEMIDQLKQKAEEACCKSNADYVRFLNENSPAKFIEVDGGIEMHLGKKGCSCPLAKELVRNREGLCFCTQGEDRILWSRFFAKPVDIEIVESCLRGGNDCVIKIGC